MPDIFLPRDIASTWDSENFVQDAWKQVSDIWAQQAHAASPDLALQAEQDAANKQQADQQAAQQAAQQQQSDAATQAGLQQAMQEQYGQQQAQQWAAQAYGQAATAATGVTPLQTAPAAPAATDQSQTAAQAPDTSGMPSGAAGNYVAAAWQAAQKHGLDPSIFVRQIQQESKFAPFNPDGSVTVSPAGARGIAQFEPDTAKSLGINPDDPLQALDGAARLMAQLKDRFGGDMAKALAAYNAGPGNVDKFGGVPPFAETQNYVKTILGDAANLGPQLAAKAQQGLGAAAQGVQDAGQAVTGAAQQAANYVFPVTGYQGAVNLHWGDVPGGSDLFADRGTPVVAMRGGKVVEAGYNSVGGNSVLIQGDDGNQYYYAHFDQAPSVKVGQTVPAGAYLGPVGNTGDAANTGTHLHIGIGPSILLGADKFGGTGGNFDAVGLLRSVLSGQGPSQAAGPANGPAALAPPTPEAQATASQPLTMGAMQPADVPSAPASGPSGFNPFRAVGDLAGSVGGAVGNAFSGLLGAGGGLLNRPQAGPNDNPGALSSPASLSVGSMPAGTIDPLSGTVPSSAPPLDQALQQGGTGGASLASPGGLPFGGGTAADLITGPLSAAYNSPLRQELAPNIGDPNHPFNVMQEMQDKYGGLLNPARMTPEDRQRYLDASMAVGGVASPLEGGRPLFGRGGVPGGPVGGLQAPPAATAPQDVESALAQSLRNLGMPEEQITALRSATNPPSEVVPTANGIGPRGANAPPISTDPADFDTNVQQALEQHAGAGGPPDGGIAPPRPLPAPGEPVTPRAPGSAWQVLSAYHSGNIVMGPATLAKVAVNATFAPAWNLVTQSARDLLTMNVDRVSGRAVGAQQALVNMGSDFMDGFTRAMGNRTTSSIPLVDDLLQAQHAVGGALHAGLQNIAAEAVRRMELGAAAGEQVAAQGGRGVSGVGQIADLIRDPTGLPEDAVARAEDLANRAGLRSPAGSVQQTVQNMLNQAANTPVGAVTNFLLPVFRIGAQAAARGIEASPIGLVGTGVDVARGAAGFGPYAGGFSQAGGAVTPLADRLTNNIAGTALTAWLGSKALDGSVTGVGPDDPRARANLEAQGWRPESVLVPGIGYVSYTRLPEQLRTPLELAGSFGDASAMHQGDAGATALEMTRQMKEMLAKGMPGISTLADLGGILKGDPYAVGFLVGGSAGGYIPGSAVLGNLASATDPTARQIQTKQGFGPAIAGSIEQNLPALREQLEPSVNVLGQTKPNPAAGLAQFLPVRTPGEVAPGTPGLQGLRVLNASGVVLPAAPPQLSVANGKSVQMTDDERQQFDQFRAALLDQAIGPLASNEKFNAAPQPARKQILDRLLQQIDTAASRQTLGSIAQSGDLVSRIGPSARLAQNTATLIRPPLALNEPSAVSSSVPQQSALPITSDMATLSPFQQDQLRQR